MTKCETTFYINDGSVRPTTYLTADGHPEEKAADGNVVELLMEESRVKITAISARTGQPIFCRQFHFLK